MAVISKEEGPMKKYSIGEGQFYITNVCNLTCDRCSSYNNRNFKGHFLWKDNKDDYQAWSEILDIDALSIIGGEPFANPDLENWISGLRALWPNVKDFSISTNGTFFKNKKELIKKFIYQKVYMDVSVHDPALYKDVEETLTECLDGFDAHSIDKGISKEIYVKDTLVAKISEAYNFSTMSVKSIKDGVTYMHDSDPVKAHSVCGCNFCHYFVRGKLYKCYLTAITQDLTNQFNIEDRAEQLLKEYDPCGPYDDPSKIETFVNKILEPIPQCRLCTDKPNIRPIWPLAKKKTDYEKI